MVVLVATPVEGVEPDRKDPDEESRRATIVNPDEGSRRATIVDADHVQILASVATANDDVGQMVA